jgi:MATE family, multidrug efflux pump
MQSWRQEIRATLSLGLPMAGAQVSQILMSTTDVALVGRLDRHALAAMAVGQAAYGMFLALGLGLIGAVGPLVSQSHGANNRKAIAQTVAIGCYAALLLSFLFWPLLYSVDHLFRWLQYTPAMQELATGYARSVMLGLPFALLFLVQKNYLDSISQPRWPMVVALAGILVNAFADYALIYGHFGLPELGVRGTGLATTVVNLFMALAVLPVAWKPEFTRALRGQTRSEWREFFAVGIPISGSIGIEVGLFVAGALMMGQLGPDEAAAHQIVIVCAATAFMIPLGISFAGSTRVGQAVGRGDFLAIRPAGLAAMAVGSAFMVATALLFVVFPEVLVTIFWDPTMAESQRVQTFAVELLLIAGVFQIVDGLQVTSMGALRGMKDVKIPLLIGGLSYWLVGLGSATYLTFHTPLRHQGLWIGFLLGLGTAAITLTLRFVLLSTRVCHDESLQKRVSVDAVTETPG